MELFSGEMAGRINVDAFSSVEIVLLVVLLYLLRRRGKSAGYLLCFSLFFLYAWAVVSFTLLDLPVDPIEIRILRARGWSTEVNLIPSLLTGNFKYWTEQVYGNFLLGVPFGFGVPFVSDYARATRRRMILVGLGFAAGIEVAQLLIGLIVYQAPYRVIDIDDVWLVFAGTLVGHLALWLVARIYRAIGWEAGARLPVWDHIHAVLLPLARGRRSAP